MAACAHIKDPRRQVYCSMILALDDAIGRISSTLSEAGMMDDTIILVR
jgi:arylsulfatase A-like enzyme